MLTISERTIDFIIDQEVSGEAYYNSRCASPTWAGGASGVTIGIGYDLGYNTAAQIASDWNMLQADTIALLQSAAGIKSISAQTFLQNNAALKAVIIPFAVAKQVFTGSSILRSAKETLGIYPGLDALEPDAAGALISMVYNRGSSLTGASRIEMKNIVPLVPLKDYNGIAQQVDQSKRLWVNKNMDGLVKRREAEASLVKNAVRNYAVTELIPVNIG